MYWGSNGDSAKRRAERPVAMWGTADVAQWLESMGWAHNYSLNAELHEVGESTRMKVGAWKGWAEKVFLFVLWRV